MVRPISRNKLFLIFIFCFSVVNATAKVFTPGAELIKENINKIYYSIDTSANAIILYEKVCITPIFNGYGLCEHKNIKKIIKILTEAGKYYGNINDAAYFSEYSFAKFSKPEGKTYNWENDSLKVSNLDELNSTQEIENDYSIALKFSMPEVKAGSIIEYEYSLDEPMRYIFGYWPYQQTLPKLYSEVEVVTNGNFIYTNFTQTTVPFMKIDGQQEIADSMLPISYYTNFITGYDEAHRRWVKRNIKAYKDEPYVSNIQNYIEKILFQQRNYRDPDWKSINNLYTHNDYFLKELNDKNIDLLKLTYRVNANVKDSTQMAKNIFHYVRDNFTNNMSGIKYKQSLQNILDVRRGSVQKINLVLIGMLRLAGISCDPVLICTTENIRLNEKLPMTNLLNYMVTRIHVNGKDYMLDPVSKYLPFGILDPRCYNGYTRVIAKDSGYAISLTPDLLVDKDVMIVNTVNSDPNNYLLKFRHFYGNVHGPSNRREWLKDTAVVRDEVIKSLSAGFELVGYKIVNLENPDTTLMLEYTVKVSWTGNNVYMPSVLTQFYNGNPFKGTERQYPIEFPYAREDIYSLNLQLPEGYTFADTTSSTEYRYDDKTTMHYTAAYEPGSNMLQVSARLSRRETYFDKEDYTSLKKYFDDVISAQQTMYVFKKL
ncbi:MAG: transglutaminase-like domain-containing protein [Flavipsychrobacter sp.]|nr:transglutaminase-like domain-containing protein [Flavipsychrobacter sp.]